MASLQQPSLFPQIVNVASVRQLSPFRYPGGKTWLVPRIRQWLQNPPVRFIEPFAGGGSISLSVAAENLAHHIIMVELDEQVAAVWKTILSNNEGEWLGQRIVEFELSLESLLAEIDRNPSVPREQAFQTILKNRTFRGGILATGAAPLKYGENGKGIQSRWYAETLRKRILEIASLRNQITFIEGDGMVVIEEFLSYPNTAFFVDPPYTIAGKKAGNRLYNCSELDHERLFSLMAQAKGDFLMSYDDNREVQKMADKHGFDTERVAMKNTHHAPMKEVLIGRDLDWLRNPQKQILGISSRNSDFD